MSEQVHASGWSGLQQERERETEVGRRKNGKRREEIEKNEKGITRGLYSRHDLVRREREKKCRTGKEGKRIEESG